MISIVIADDHQPIREGIKKILRSAADIRVVGEAADIVETIRLARQHDPDLIVLDIGLPGNGGGDGLKEVFSQCPDIPILALSTFPEQGFEDRALKTGAAGYMAKTMVGKELIDTIRRTVVSGIYMTVRQWRNVA
jgi:DNA-binding NarL/FixJ family response regulator